MDGSKGSPLQLCGGGTQEPGAYGKTGPGPPFFPTLFNKRHQRRMYSSLRYLHLKFQGPQDSAFQRTTGRTTL